MTTLTAQERLIDALRAHGSVVDDRNAAKTKAQCPAHDDNSPSLSISPRRDGKGVVMYCHAGCDTGTVLQVLGWATSDLFDDDRARQVFSPRRDYRYPDGRVVHRKPGKQFPQSGNLKGDSLFNADRIGAAQTVYVTEGEKDVEAIEQLAGAAAVSSPMGAGKAHLADWSPLLGKDVTVIADRDEAGGKHAAQVAELLSGVAASVRIVAAKAGKDVADHLAAGHTLDELVPAQDDAPAPERDVAVDEKPGRRSVAAQLVDLARTHYRLGVTDTDDAFGVTAEHPHIALMLRGGKTGLRAELSRRHFADTDSVASQQALADACMVLEGFAAQEDPQRVYLRVAEQGGAVYIDLGDTECRVIEITGGRWRITDTAPVLFRRTKLTGALPYPHPGKLDALWSFIGIDVDDRPILLAVLVAALVQVDVPHVVLVLLAEQGSAKSTATRLLVSLIDPSAVPLRQPPRDQDGWTTAAAASWVVALDNLSGEIPTWLSDSLCRASTGDGSVKRALYTDSDVSVLAFRRCIIANGVDIVVDRGDLAERVARVGLPRVTARKPEDELVQAWEKARPGVLGALLDLAAAVHHRLPAIDVGDLPRMADFAKVLAAVDEVLGTDGLTRYRQQSRRAAADTLDVPFIGELVAAERPFEGVKSAELLAALTPATAEWRKPRGWPKNSRAVTGLLTRHAPALRAQGWQVDSDEGHNKDGITQWTIRGPEKAGGDTPPNPPNPPLQVNVHKSGGSSENLFPASSPPDPPGGLLAGQAGYGKIVDPPENNLLTSENGSAGQAGHENPPSLVPVESEHCQVCERPIPEHMHASLARGVCSRCTAIETAKVRLSGGAV
ncbi:toprim domain-containing protein [Mycolicibacterium sp. CR10]|uniref:toprim domain-containing protein n=1 Tax=Mycolicibacterium sp. CR10 TaxID=2562314 RepID=UPI001485160A|nr:toprim domain-containing protein [Mycolicibacterium sp. CR10]